MIYVMTLAYAPHKMLEASLNTFHETIGLDKSEYTHIIVDNYWPKDRSNMLALLEKERVEHGAVIKTPEKNLGLAGGFNFALAGIDLKEDDTIFAYDPDVFPLTVGWGKAFKTALSDKSVGWVSIWNPVTDQELATKESHEEIINGLKVTVLHQPILNSISGFSSAFFRSSGGAHEPNPFYGGFEISMWHKLKEANLKWVFLKDFNEITAPEKFVDVEYRAYKWFTTHKGEKQVEFPEWIELKRHSMLSKMEVLPGWCPHSKALRLYELVLQNKPKVIVEIGVYGGRSLVALAEAAQLTNSHVIGIDPYTESHCQQYALDGGKIDHGFINWDEIKKSANDAILHLENTVLLEMTNEDALISFPFANVDFIHIDGNHSAENVLKDLELWSHKMSKDCVVVMDDINFDMVNYAIEKYGKLTKLEDHGTWGVYKHL